MHRLSYERRCLEADHVKPVAEDADVAEHEDHETEQEEWVLHVVADPGVLELAAAGHKAALALLDLTGDAPHVGGGLAVAAARRLVALADSSDRAG